MTERHDSHDHGSQEPFDHEIDTRAVVRVGIQLIVVTLVSVALMWPLLKGLGKLDARSDAPPVALQAERDALARQGPAGPILQASPQGDLQAMRAAEKLVLEGYGWVDASHTVARVPIARAIELLAASAPAAPGATPMPTVEPTAPAAPAAPAHGTPGH
jgi:hypothetical protein